MSSPGPFRTDVIDGSTLPIQFDILHPNGSDQGRAKKKVMLDELRSIKEGRLIAQNSQSFDAAIPGLKPNG